LIVAALKNGPCSSPEMAAACGRGIDDRNYNLARKGLLEDKTITYAGSGGSRRYSLPAAEVAEPEQPKPKAHEPLEAAILKALEGGPLESKALGEACEQTNIKGFPYCKAKRSLLAAGKIIDVGRGSGRQRNYAPPPVEAAA
jgi:hypothetical protein